MPRGVPKDPNHPRNLAKKGKAEAVADAPKRRGRPPGSKNAKKDQAAEPVTASAPKAAKKAALPGLNKELVAKTASVSDTFEIRQNIETLCRAVTATSAQNPAIVTALEAQVQRLAAITEEADKTPTEVVAAPTPAPAKTAPVAATNGPTQQQPAPLPSPPSFMPPPFPPSVPQS